MRGVQIVGSDLCWQREDCNPQEFQLVGTEAVPADLSFFFFDFSGYMAQL